MRPIRFALIIAVLLSPGLTGCLAIHTAKRVSRRNEPRKAVHFASVRAWETFHFKFSQLEAPKKNTSTFLVPFLALHTKEWTLSPNAFYNDEITRCDIDGDGTITDEEARAYNELGLPPPEFKRGPE